MMVDTMVLMLGLLAVAVERMISRRGQTPVEALFLAPFYACLTVLQVVVGDLSSAVVDATLAALFGWVIWRWWSGRRPRRRASRAAGRIRDLGHRLVVAPA